MFWKPLILLMLAASFLYELLLKRLALRSADRPIPQSVADVYDEETYRTRLRYSADKNRLGIWLSTATFAAEALLLLTNAYAAFAGLFPAGDFREAFSSPLLYSAVSLVAVPFAYYDTMVIEQRYGFNRMSKKTFFSDRIKEFVLQLIISFGASYMLWSLHFRFGDWLILAFAVIATLILLFAAFFLPFFSKMFNKFKPLEDGELKDRLTALLEKNGYRVRAVKVMDASRRTTKANAYFAGFGKMKTIVLFDTLLELMNEDEICAVFAHELGHGLHKDTLKNQLFVFLEMLALGALAWVAVSFPGLHTAFGFSEVNYGFAVVLLLTAGFAFFRPLFLLAGNALTRRAEYRADAQAVKEGMGEALISSLKKLARQNFADLAPCGLLVALEYSHPPLALRIDAIREKMGHRVG